LPPNELSTERSNRFNQAIFNYAIKPTTMSIQTRIYAGGAFAFGQQLAVNDLQTSGYSAIIIWSVHVSATGSLSLNNTAFVANGVYSEAETMNLPNRLAQLSKAGMQIIFSVGSGGVGDYANIEALLNGGVPGPGNALYDNFLALKTAMVNAGGNIDTIDFDNEEIQPGYNSKSMAQVMTNFGIMLGNIGYNSVSFCPYFTDSAWSDAYTNLLAKMGKNFVSAIHYQCYSGGMYNDPQDFGPMIANGGGNTLLIPGLATNQAAPGPWWDGDNKAPGGSVVKTPDVAMYGKADWSNMLWQGNFSSPDAAMQSVKGGETFFFYCNGYLDLGSGKQFQPGDAVFFGGLPWWGSAPQCDAYSLSGGCTNIWNNPVPSPPSTQGACPADLQGRYTAWNNQQYPVNGGFIWMYDSIVNCVLSGCCNEGGQTSAQVATVYQQAIVNGLT
jgi:hypothetical protein